VTRGTKPAVCRAEAASHAVTVGMGKLSRESVTMVLMTWVHSANVKVEKAVMGRAERYVIAVITALKQLERSRENWGVGVCTVVNFGRGRGME
jgi:hypothetical protein